MDTTLTPSAGEAYENWRSLADYGEAVDCSARRISLHQQNALWLVTDGTFDLFAVDAGTRGRWVHIGRLLPGTILIAPVAGPRHSLLIRPSADAGLHRLSVRALAALALTGAVHDGSEHTLRPWERALTDGIDAGLAVLMAFIRGDLPPKDFVPLFSGRETTLAAGQNARPAAGVLWVDVLQGELRVSGPTGFLDHHAGDSATLGQHDWISSQSSARVRARSTRDVYRSGELWEKVLQFENRSLYLLDRAIELQERHSFHRIAASRDITRAVAERADLALGDVLTTTHRANPWRSVGGEDATTAACRVVAEAMHIDHFPTDGPPIHTQAGPIEQVATRARLRTRTISLNGTWWRANIGPFVGHRTSDFSPVAFVWERGRYRAWAPVSGEITVLNEQAAADYETRAVMFYKPLPERAVSNWTLVRSGFRGAAGDIRTVVTGTLFAVLLGALVPILTGTVLGSLVPAARTSLITQICVGLLLAGVASTAFGVMENIALTRLEGRFETTVQTAVWDRLLRLPTSFFKNYSTGELASAALGVADLRTVLMGVSSTVLYSSAVVLVNLVVLFAISLPFALLGAGFALGGVGVFLLLGFRQMKWQKESLQLNFQLTNNVFQKLRGLLKLRVAAAEDRAYANWAGTFSRQKHVQKRIGRYQNSITVFNAAYPQFCLLVLFVVESSTGSGIPVAEFLTFLAALTLMLSSITQVTAGITSAISVVPIFDRMKPILQHPLESSTQSTDPGELSGHIEVSHVTFGYSKEAPPVLSDISFRVLPGEFVAVVGASGGGKSTLLRLLLGFETPDAGTVLYDGQDLSSLDRAAVRRQCGVVLQQSKPFSGSIFKAITGAMNYSMAEAMEAAELAGLSEDIAAMPMGMHTVINDESSLSGGQRQRLMIARALIRRPRILFFDEATSALDNRTQRIVTEATERLKATRVVIAHRLSTVMEADKILVLSQGHTEQYGPPADLLADRAGLFHQLVHRQIQ